MIRLSDTILLAIAIGGAIWTYQIKHEAEQSARNLVSLRAQIAAQDRKIALLEADWALEINPARLEKIAADYNEQLNLKMLESSQIIDTTELPGLRIDRSLEDTETYAGQDEVVTGGIGALIERQAEE